MNAERWQKAKALFEAASGLDPNERDEFLAGACGSDHELIDEVKRLLASLESADSFLESPAVAEAASMFEERKTAIAGTSTGEVKGGEFVAGTMLADRYRILGLIGKGGMGEVYKAEDIKLSQIVALKFLPDRLERDRAALDRFHAEVRTARQVSHANVCRVFDIGEIGGRHFLSMEYIHGDDLSSMLRRIGRLPSDKAVVIARQLCFGLAAIHDAGILHRDLKPANVIIDDNGRARITDFGIAGVEKELSGSEIRVGTPAYMSPEQITGDDVSQKSDIYSLGLLMYECFTGKQTFKADSIDDLLQKQRTTAPTNPSDVLKDIDPLVEKTILQCLEKDPAERPKNALQVAMMLPGGNPLEAAMAAGETPSPEMVAAAPKKGALRPIVAVACLLAAIALLGFVILLSGRVKQDQWVPLEKSPEILAERADSILKKLGYTAPPVDTDFGFASDQDNYLNHTGDERSPDAWEKIRTGQPAVLFFWHRTSPRYLEPQNYAYETVWLNDPPNDIAGMTRILLDGRGRLLEFEAVPPQVRDEAVDPRDIDWSTLFAEAGLDIRNYRQTEAKWTPPFYADSILAWEGTHVDHPELSVQIEAAAFRGKPVYFQIVAPWDKPIRQEEASSTPGRRAAGVILTLMLASVIIAGVILARRNLRRGRSDAKGAFKVTIFVFLISLSASLLIADHMPDLGRELGLLFKVTGSALFVSALIGLVYLALEPYVRRRWPDLIISWSRMLAGDFRDPMVGRDVLVGGLLGVAHTAVIYLMYLGPRYLGIDASIRPNEGLNPSYLGGFKHVAAQFLGAPVAGIISAFFILLFLVLLVTIFRKQWLATAVMWTMIFSVLGLAFASRGGHWIFWSGPALIAAIIVVCISRYGLLAMISFQVFFELTFHNAISANFSSWYFGNTIAAVIVLMGLIIFGFHTSLAGQKIIDPRFLSDGES